MNRWLSATLLALATALSFCAHAAAPLPEPVRAVYQVDEGDEQARRALRNIRNHLEADPGVKITVVALGPGIDFLLEGEKDAGGYPFALNVEDLAGEGVRFEVCGNTLKTRHIDTARLLPQAVVVTSGFAELARLQFREGYAYLRP